MTHDDIIRMALEAGFRIDGNEVTESDGYLIQTELLTDFAELVADAELRKCLAALESGRPDIRHIAIERLRARLEKNYE